MFQAVVGDYGVKSAFGEGKLRGVGLDGVAPASVERLPVQADDKGTGARICVETSGAGAEVEDSRALGKVP